VRASARIRGPEETCLLIPLAIALPGIGRTNSWLFCRRRLGGECVTRQRLLSGKGMPPWRQFPRAPGRGSHIQEPIVRIRNVEGMCASDISPQCRWPGGNNLWESPREVFPTAMAASALRCSLASFGVWHFVSPEQGSQTDTKRVRCQVCSTRLGLQSGQEATTVGYVQLGNKHAEEDGHC
jgi:hypothetical protein